MSQLYIPPLNQALAAIQEGNLVSDCRSLVLYFDPAKKTQTPEKIEKSINSFMKNALSFLECHKIEAIDANCFDMVFPTKKVGNSRIPMGLCYIHFMSSYLFFMALGLDLNGDGFFPDRNNQISLPDSKFKGAICRKIVRKDGKKKTRKYAIIPKTFPVQYEDNFEDRDTSKLFGIIPSYVHKFDMQILMAPYSVNFPMYPKIGFSEAKNGKKKVFIQFDPETDDAIFAKNMFTFRQFDIYDEENVLYENTLVRLDFAMFR